MKQEVIDNHISLYVNEFSISLGKEGRSAVEKIFELKDLSTQSLFLSNL